MGTLVIGLKQNRDRDVRQVAAQLHLYRNTRNMARLLREKIRSLGTPRPALEPRTINEALGKSAPETHQPSATALSRSRRRMTLPDVVSGRLSRNSISRGYSCIDSRVFTQSRISAASSALAT